mmetsp:Transcript_5662/g.8338  ORF Transcript_5662/g.8338 Transcript_5662/m.8338 type:complete len:615 (+) Transcript_5662:5263-7107(+)
MNTSTINKSVSTRECSVLLIKNNKKKNLTRSFSTMEDGLELMFDYVSALERGVSRRVNRTWRKAAESEYGWYKSCIQRWWHREEFKKRKHWRKWFLQRWTMEGKIGQCVLQIQDVRLACTKIEGVVDEAWNLGIDIREYLVSIGAICGENYCAEQFKPFNTKSSSFRSPPEASTKRLVSFLAGPCPELNTMFTQKKTIFLYLQAQKFDHIGKLAAIALAAFLTRRADILVFDCSDKNMEDGFIAIAESLRIFFDADAVYSELNRLAKLTLDLAKRKSIMCFDQDLIRRNKTQALEWLLLDEASSEFFCGNSKNYYDERNSFLDCVLATKFGIPITLAVIFIAVARRAGIEDYYLVNAPGHVFVYDKKENMYLDVFRQKSIPENTHYLHTSIRLTQNQVLTLLSAHNSLPNLVARALVTPPIPEMLLRALRNLQIIYTHSRQPTSLVASFLVVLGQSLVGDIISSSDENRTHADDLVLRAVRRVAGPYSRVTALDRLGTDEGTFLLPRTLLIDAKKLQECNEFLPSNYRTTINTCLHNVRSRLSQHRDAILHIQPERNEFFFSSDFTSFVDEPPCSNKNSAHYDVVSSGASATATVATHEDEDDRFIDDDDEDDY